MWVQLPENFPEACYFSSAQKECDVTCKLTVTALKDRYPKFKPQAWNMQRSNLNSGWDFCMGNIEKLLLSADSEEIL